MLLWSYFAAVTTDPGRVPPGWHPFEDEATARSELDRLSELDYAFDRRDPRRPRFCKRCQAWKPERAHHCRCGPEALQGVALWRCMQMPQALKIDRCTARRFRFASFK